MIRLATIWTFAALTLSCADRSDVKAAASTGDREDASAGAAPQKAESKLEAPAETTRDAVQPPPEGGGVDCGSVVTAAELEEACGTAMQQEITRGEGNMPLNTCSRKFRGPDERSVSFKLAIHDSVAKVSSIPWKDGAIGIADLGDAAHAYVEDKGGQFDWHTVEVRSADRILYLRSINASGATPLCSTEQLTKVARTAIPRLQTSE